MDAGAAGLAMSYAATFTGNLLWLIRLHTANEQEMNSMERVGEYLDVPQEGPTAVPAKGWTGGQGGGAIEFVDYSAHYGNERETVLRNLRLSIGAREKIGVVGRTGPGKTSLALTLVRALEAASGWILLDGEAVCAMPLRQLRENVVMVPQDPILFSGNVRSNLDPLLREPLVLLMDESTASLDANTAARIQDNLRAQTCTTITIAHRLPSIIDCDRVVVLEAGRTIEVSRPRELLAVSGSVFAALWHEQHTSSSIDIG
ncbi:Canalicular multispecific organic anion transporter 1 [Lasiodiplodia theobromae]|uniref:Canalicular multispecific organic anion transporter 1 n=1 Tax=Lasiodiplodia theobromae TaxID=45133 RepID=A0A5N5CYS3_9PEZI|nr:Canalicular multispecific organic anion transporter 1 [Lasiodiplodia theobromae]